MTGVALVTGGGRGLGRDIARRLVADGWAVAVTGRTPGPLEEVGAALALPGDATDRTDVERAVHEATTRLGPLDLVVANAGRFATGGQLWTTDPDDWWRDVEVNLRGTSLLLWAALPAMVRRGSGRVVALGSGFGNVPTVAGSGYGVAKTAVHRLVETVAAELAGTGVTAYAVSPGRARTDMTTGFPPGFLEAHPAMRQPPAEGWADPALVAGLVARIATGELDALTGRFLHVTTDLSSALAVAGKDPDRGTLRLVPWT